MSKWAQYFCFVAGLVIAWRGGGPWLALAMFFITLGVCLLME